MSNSKIKITGEEGGEGAAREEVVSPDVDAEVNSVAGDLVVGSDITGVDAGGGLVAGVVDGRGLADVGARVDAVVSCTPAGKDRLVGQQLYEARVAIREKRYPDADRLLGVLLSEYPDDPGIVSLQAYLLVRQSGRDPRRLREAEDTIRRFIDRGVIDPFLRIHLSDLYIRERRFQEARVLLEEVAEGGFDNRVRARALLSLAMSYMHEGRPVVPPKVFEILERATKLNRRDFRIATALAKAHRVAGNLGQAEESLLRLRVKKPDDPYILRELIMVYILLKRFRDADELLAQKGGIQSCGVSECRMFGDAFFQSERFDLAAECFRRSESVSPQPYTVYRLALCEEALHNREKANVLYREMLKHPLIKRRKFVYILLTLGKRAREEGDLEMAELFYKKIIEIDPKSHQAMTTLGCIARARGDYVEALRWLRMSDGVRPSDHVNLCATAAVFADQGDFENAARVLQASLEADGEDISTLLQLGLLALNQRRFAVADEIFRRMTAIDAESPETLFFQGRLMEVRGRKGEAREAFKNGLKNWAENSDNIKIELLIEIGLLELRSGNKDSARGYFENAYSLRPNDCHVLNALGEFALKENRFDDAIEYFRQSLKRGSLKKSTLYLISKAYCLKGDKVSARRHLTTFIQSYVPDIPVLMLLAIVVPANDGLWGVIKAGVDPGKLRTLKFRTGADMDPALLEELERSEGESGGALHQNVLWETGGVPVDRLASDVTDWPRDGSAEGGNDY